MFRKTLAAVGGLAMPARARRTRVPATAIGLFAGVFALELALDDHHAGVLHLHAVPIATLTLVFGYAAGLIGVGLALALLAVWAELEEVGLGPITYGGWAVPLLLIVLLCQVVREVEQGSLASDGHRPVSDRLTTRQAKGLTAREVQVLELIALGYTNVAIAKQLVLSPRTVESHRARIQEKLNLSGRAELVRYALERGLVHRESGPP